MGKNSAVVIGLLISCLVFFSISEVGVVKAESTIYINQNGEIESTDLIERNGNLYRFKGNISAPIVVERNGIIIDGNGYSLQGSGYGCALNLTTSNVTVKNIHILGWDIGILGAFNNNTVFNNFITGCNYGININADYYNINENYLANNDKGIYLGRVSSFILISKNYITNNNRGLEIYSYASKGGIKIAENIISFNDLGIFVTWVYQKLPQDIYRNNFIENTRQVLTSGPSPVLGKHRASAWNKDSEGNYWSDYNGTDDNNDGIGDTPYVINNYDSDIYPLISPLDIETIPEFPSWIILPLFLMATLSAIIVKKRLFHQRS